MVAVLGVAAGGICWTFWPTTTVGVAVAVCACSVVATANASPGNLHFAVFTEFVVMPVLFGVLLAAPRRSRRWLAGGVAAVAESMSLRASDAPIRAIVAISMLVLLGAAGIAVIYIRLRDTERRSSIDRARHNERLDLARELHDVVGHHVTGIVVLAQANRFTATAMVDPQTNERAMAAIETAGSAALTAIRRLVGLLRADPSSTAGSPRLEDIEQLVEQLCHTHPLTELVVDESLRANWIPVDLATTIYRFAQEATTNVRKHGDPERPVVFTLRQTEVAIEFNAENTTMRPTSTEGFGITGMRERVNALGGTFRAGGVSRQWRVEATLPLGAPVAR